MAAQARKLESQRLEEAYRDYSHDIDNLDTPLEVGLGFTVDYDKPGGFIGRETFLRQKESRILRKRLVQFLLENPKPLIFGGEMIFCDGERVGYLHIGVYVQTMGRAVGLGSVHRDEDVSKEYIQPGNFRSSSWRSLPSQSYSTSYGRS